MQKFSGFPDGDLALTSLPVLFFRELLPMIDHLGELKLTLHIFWRLTQMEGHFRYVRKAELLQDRALLAGMNLEGEAGEAAIVEAIARAVQRGTLLVASIELDGRQEELYFLNSAKGRAAIEAIQRGEWRPSGDTHQPIELAAEKPNIYRLYEEHIGPLTPLIAEALREAEETYPAHWVERAYRIAVENNVRNWRYIAAILERWQKDGTYEREDRRDTEKARRRYIEGEFSDFIEH